jgi:cell division protein FtsW
MGMGIHISTTAEDRGFDRPLFISVILLVGFGIVMVYSASAVRASYEHNDPTHFLVRQVVFALLGVLAMLIASQIDYRWYKKIIYPLLGLSILGLFLCYSPLGRTINGASRWIGLGPMTIQPSEVVKLAMVLWLSYSLDKKSAKIKSFSIGFLPHLILPGFVIMLCLFQPDFGTAIIIALMTFSLLFVAGAKIGYIMAAGLCAAPIVYFLVAGSEYRLKRVLAFLDPISHRYDEAYQLIQSLYGFAGGGFWGTGLGDGLQKFFFLPEAHNDFIASIIAEEFGVIGIWLLLIIFSVLLARGVLIALRAQDQFGTYVAFGITILIGVQTLANMGVSMGLLPTKGLNLPFISAGGSALVVSLFSVGVLLNISKERYAAAEAPRPSRPSTENQRQSGKREKR